MVKQIARVRTGTSKGSELEELRALLAWPGLQQMADACDDYFSLLQQRTGGARRMPTVILLFTAAAARISGSLASAISTLSEPAVWEMLREVWTEELDLEEHQFPDFCPNRERVRSFIDRLTRIEAWCVECSRVDVRTRETEHDCKPGVPHWHDFLQDRFQDVAMRQAKAQGNLHRPDDLDWAAPDLKNTVIGDGTVVTPYSDVLRVKNALKNGKDDGDDDEEEDEAPNEIIVGSRASGARDGTARPRQAPGTDLKEDGKAHLAGLNMVSMLTPTAHGWVVLGTGHASSAEQWAALDLLNSVAPRAGGGVRTLLWDRVFTGWLLDHAMGAHGIRVVNKSVGAPKKKDKSSAYRLDEDEMTAPASEKQLRHSADELLRRIESDGRFEIKLARLSEEERGRLRSQELSALRAYMRDGEAKRLYDSGLALPLGVCVYRSTSASTVTGARNQANHEKHKVVRTKFRRLGTVAHLEDDACQHLLYTDDGGLHSVEFDGTHLLKTSTARCLSSKLRERGPGLYGSTETWAVPCEKGDLVFDTHWDPSPVRHKPASDIRERKASDPVLNDLRPISRHDEQAFADIANARNNAESFNHFFKSRLPGTKPRAASLYRDSQLLDFLNVAMICNAITWRGWVRATHW